MVTASKLVPLHQPCFFHIHLPEAKRLRLLTPTPDQATSLLDPPAPGPHCLQDSPISTPDPQGLPQLPTPTSVSSCPRVQMPPWEPGIPRKLLAVSHLGAFAQLLPLVEILSSGLGESNPCLFQDSAQLSPPPGSPPSPARLHQASLL